MSTPRFAFEETADQSLTVRIYSIGADGEESSESMHSLRGAFSETVYIYGTAIDLALERGFTPRVLSMGLGIGYVELLATARFLQKGVRGGGESFEILPELREWFLDWLRGKKVPVDFREAYDAIAVRTAAESGLAADDIKAELLAMIDDGRWLVREALEPATDFAGRFGCVCFDAFSSKSTPEIWTEDFLVAFLEKAAEPSCVLSTYACTGALKRALRRSEFELTIREGFASKRDSTFAVRDRKTD